MNHQAINWGQHGNGGQPHPAVPQTVLQQPLGYRQCMAQQPLPVQLGPYRSYAQVVRDFLSGKMSATGAPPAHRPFSHQSMGTYPNLSSFAPAPPSRSVPGHGDQNLTDPAIRGASRLDLDAANRNQAPSWFNVSMDMVAIYIQGENGIADGPPFYVHKDFIQHASPYFSAAFSSGFSESTTQTLYFEDCKREIFALLIQWVYKQDLQALSGFELEDRKNLPLGVGLSTLQGDQLNDYIKKSQELALEHTIKLIDLWFLADKVLMPELQNAAILAIDALRFFTPLQGLPADICAAVYAKTPVGSPLRKYLADTTLRRLHPNAEDEGEDFPSDMLADIFNRVKVVGSDARLRHFGLSEKSMEAFLVEVKGDAHLKANPSANPPLADNIWVRLWELRRDAMKF
ncbi:hypothetical protein EYC84_009216 [Monilinia fructicola]|uniref:BTB domain-containing protein n=1 Tax=Monilinia fructicola TaxID=38448 RepID=A0A5M9JBP3_MONFR|nr:hypothetical protein EYC84_009216 [Monilinia fructicola]